jgi:uncharacterized SAM-binding protein YcdF (DUF218 family)
LNADAVGDPFDASVLQMMRFWRAHRLWVVIGSVVMVIVVAFVVLTSVLFIRPATNTPQRVDAIVVLDGNPWSARWQKGVDLAREGYAPVLVQSNVPWTPCPHGPPRVEVICFYPSPASTRGEAIAVARLATQHHWHRLLIVTNVPQVTRARIRVDRCYHGVTLFEAVNPEGVGSWLHNLVYEWGALGKALILQRSCGSGTTVRTQTVPASAAPPG